MIKKKRGLLVSMTASLIAIVLLVVVLLLHAFGVSAAATEETADHQLSFPSSAEAASPVEEGHSMVMPDGSTMDAEDMNSTDPESVGAGSAAFPAETAHQSMGGPVDWQAIGLILALVSAGVALGTATNEYLRRQVASGALAQAEAAHE